MSGRRVWKGWVRWCFYGCFFMSGFASLVFEVLWSREFVTVFGNSSYAVSIVLCAYMAGLGLGGVLGGRLADRMTRRATAYGGVQLAIAAWALLIPLLLDRLRILVPTIPALSPESLLVSTLARFGLSFAILLLPCFLMGTTLPLLARVVTDSEQSIGTRIGALYGWNTLGAASGCLAAGFWLTDTFGLRLTNAFAVGVNLLVALAVFILPKPMVVESNTAPAGAPAATPIGVPVAPEATEQTAIPGILLLSVAFLNGFASLACEVLWIRYLGFLSATAYVFPTFLCVYLLGLGVGGLVYAVWTRRIGLSVRALAILEMLLAIGVLAAFVAGALLFAGGPPQPLDLKGMAFLTAFPPTLVMGMIFPLLCSVYGCQVTTLGRRAGLLFAVNTAGTVFGALLPLFVLVPALGIQTSLLFTALLYGAMGVALLVYSAGVKRGPAIVAAVVYGGAMLFLGTAAPSNLCQRVFLATDFNLARHTDILFYREGRTGTAIVASNRVSNCKTVYINGIAEVPLGYPHQLCFKMLGDLGPMLHPNPDDVLMICFGGGIAAGATTCVPGVKSLTIVDLESSVVEAAHLLVKENNGLLQDPRVRLVIDDGRDYLMTARRRWPVIISDSTHPKSGDSWVLYTREFYQLVHDRLTPDGIFVQWVPMHSLTAAEFKIIVRTFQSVFPHTSLWVTHGMDADGQFVAYSLVVATPKPLSIDLARLRERLDASAVRRDLEAYGLQSPAGFLDSFLCGEDAFRRWTGYGPINTDDLPYTQYDTRYSKGTDLNLGEFIELMGDIWPCVTGAGSDLAAKQLHDELVLRAKASRLAFLGRFEESYALLPQEARYRQMRCLYEEGPRYIRALLKMYRDNPQALNRLAGLSELGPDGGGVTLEPIYERVLALDPQNVIALSMLGAIHLTAGDLKPAETYLRSAVRLAPEFATARYNLGVLLYSTQRRAEAIREWEAAALASRESAAAADQWGVCLAGQGRVEEAILWFNHALEISPTAVTPRLHLATALGQTGRGQEALLHVRYLLKMDPEDKEALRILAKLEGRAQVPPEP
jgi:spermidine synthase